MRDSTKNSTPIQILGLSLFLWGGLMSVSAGASETNGESMSPQLRPHLQRVRAQLGELQGRQSEIFQSEVLPESDRFVRDYKSSGGRVTRVDVDVEGIRRFIDFNVSKILKPESNQVLIFSQASPNCAPCVKASDVIRGDLKARLERRGFQVLIPTGEEMRADPREVYRARNAAGWVSSSVRSIVSAGRSGVQHYSLTLDFRFPGTVASSTQKQVEILATDPIEPAMARLSVDAIAEIARKAQVASSTPNEAPGLELELEGLPSFASLSQVKARLQSGLGGDYRIVEMRIEREGKAALAVWATGGGSVPAARVAEELSGSSFNGFSLQVLGVGSNQVRARAIAAAEGGRS